MKKEESVLKKKRSTSNTTKKKNSIKRKISISNLKNQSIFIENDKQLLNSYQSLIDNKGYTNYLNEDYQKGYMIKCIKHNLNYYFNQKEYKYPYPNSNKQFLTYVKNCLEHKVFGDLAKLQAVLTQYISFDFSFKVISYITKNINNDLKDTDILDLIKSNTENISKMKVNQIKKFSHSCDSLTYIMENISNNIIKTLTTINPEYKNKNFQEVKFLDLGCEYMDFSIEIKKILNISKNHYYGIHLPKISIPNQNQIVPENFKNLSNIHKLPFDDNTFDFIFIHTFIQKVFDLPSLLNELKRILKPNGFIFMITIMGLEKNDNLLSDIINTLKNIFVKKKNIYEYIKNPEYMRYFNYKQWDYVMKKFDFKYNNFGYLKSGFRESITQNNYTTYAIYQVIK